MSCAVPGQREEREIFHRRWKLERMGLWLVNPVGEAVAYYSTKGAVKRSRVFSTALAPATTSVDEREKPYRTLW